MSKQQAMNAILEFACNQEFYQIFHVLCTEHNIEENIKEEPKLFILYHMTRIKYLLEQHFKTPKANILSDNLHEILQSFCYMTPKYQPKHIQKYLNSLNKVINDTIIQTHYNLHQQIKIHAILTCNKAHHLRQRLLDENFKVRSVDDPNSSLINALNFHHLENPDDMDEEHQFEIMNIYLNLKKKKRSKEKQEFIKDNNIDIFKQNLYDFLNKMKNFYCNDMNNIIYDSAKEMIQINKENVNHNKKMNKKRKANGKVTKPLSDATATLNRNSDGKDTTSLRSKAYNVYDTNNQTNPKCIDEYKIGMRVKVRQNNKHQSINNDENVCNDKYVWKIGKIIQTNKFRITVELQHGGHMRITDMNKIKLCDDEEVSNNRMDEDDDDDVMISDHMIIVDDNNNDNTDWNKENIDANNINNDCDENMVTSSDEEEDSDIEIIANGNSNNKVNESDNESPDIDISNDEEQDEEEEGDEGEEDDDDAKMMELEEENEKNKNKNKNINKNQKRGKQKKKASKKKRKKRTIWTADEHAAFVAGVTKYEHLLETRKRGKKGIWTEIKNDQEFAERLRNRTTSHIKDHYRAWVKNNNTHD